MSDLLTASQRFEAESKKQVESTRETVRSVLDQHERDLNQCLQDAQKQIESSIHEHKRRMIWLVMWIWIPVTLVILVMMVAALGWGWWQQATLTRQHNEIVQRRQKLQKLPNLMTHKCHHGRTCIKVNPAFKPQGPNHEYYVPAKPNGGL